MMNSHQLVKVAGIGTGQLQRWTEAGIIGTLTRARGGRGHARRFTLTDAIRAGIVRNLTRRRMSVKTAGKIARSLTAHHSVGYLQLEPRAFAVIHRDHPQHARRSSRFEVLNPRKAKNPTAVITFDPDTTMVEIRKAPGPIHLIALGEIVERISARYHRQAKTFSR
jgi:hypothetical protein